MNINIVLRSTNKIEHTIKCKSLEQAHKQMVRYQKRLPNSYNRQKQSRLYCFTKDKHLQRLSGDSKFWFSMYSGKQYVYKLVLGSTHTKD